MPPTDRRCRCCSYSLLTVGIDNPVASTGYRTESIRATVALATKEPHVTAQEAVMGRTLLLAVPGCPPHHLRLYRLLLLLCWVGRRLVVLVGQKNRRVPPSTTGRRKNLPCGSAYTTTTTVGHRSLVLGGQWTRRAGQDSNGSGDGQGSRVVRGKG